MKSTRLLPLLLLLVSATALHAQRPFWYWSPEHFQIPFPKSVLHAPDTVSTVTCNEPFINGEFSEDSTGTYTHIYSTVNGCDSI